MSNETKVTFNLWLVLSFIVALGLLAFTVLGAEQLKTKEKQQEICERVVKLETQYDNIIKGQEKVAITLEKLADKIDAQDQALRRSSREARDKTTLKGRE